MKTKLFNAFLVLVILTWLTLTGLMAVIAQQCVITGKPLPRPYVIAWVIGFILLFILSMGFGNFKKIKKK